MSLFPILFLSLAPPTCPPSNPSRTTLYSQVNIHFFFIITDDRRTEREDRTSCYFSQVICPYAGVGVRTWEQVPARDLSMGPLWSWSCRGLGARQCSISMGPSTAAACWSLCRSSIWMTDYLSKTPADLGVDLYGVLSPWKQFFEFLDANGS